MLLNNYLPRPQSYHGCGACGAYACQNEANSIDDDFEQDDPPRVALVESGCCHIWGFLGVLI